MLSRPFARTAAAGSAGKHSPRLPFVCFAFIAVVAAVVSLAVPAAQAVPAQTRSAGGYCSPSGNDGGKIRADVVLSRAARWVHAHVPYTERCASVPGGYYREDSSGFVSMAWRLPESLVTQDFDPKTNDGDPRFQVLTHYCYLQPGDALVVDNRLNHNIVLFTGWSSRDAGRCRFANLEVDDHLSGQPSPGTVRFPGEDLRDSLWRQFTLIHYVDMTPAPPEVSAGGSASRDAGYSTRRDGEHQHGALWRVFWTGADGQLKQSWWPGVSWKTQSLGGGLVGTPAATHRGVGNSGRYDVFAVSPGRHLYQKTYQNHSWGRWHRIAAGYTFTPGVSAVAVRTGARVEYHVFGHDPAGHLLQAYWADHGWHVQDLGGVTEGTPASTYHDGQYDVFAVSPGGNLYQRTYSVRRWDNHNWTPWHRIAAGFIPGAGVSAVWGAPGLEVFGLNDAGQMRNAYQAGGQWNTKNLGGKFTASLGVSYFDRRLDVYGRTAHGVYHSYYNTAYSTRWSPWDRVS